MQGSGISKELAKYFPSISDFPNQPALFEGGTPESVLFISLLPSTHKDLEKGQCSLWPDLFSHSLGSGKGIVSPVGSWMSVNYQERVRCQQT